MTPKDARILPPPAVDDLHKDPSGLTDFHRIPLPGAPSIDKAGINRFRVPALFQHRDGTVMNHDAEAAMYVSCPAGHTGINMSRLCHMVLDELSKSPVNMCRIKALLGRFRSEMRNSSDEPLFPASFFELSFNYPVRQTALKSGYEGWQYYACHYAAREDDRGRRQVLLTVNYEYSSACPCSLAMSKQYEAEYADGKTEEGNGAAVAHSQRSNARVTVELDPAADFFVEDLVDTLRAAIPTETQAFAKRVDEQAFAVLNGAHPLFVEHASRNLHRALNADVRVKDWTAEVEHWESLHSHNAAARICKGLPGGLS